MDEIEAGFKKMTDMIEEMKKTESKLSEEIRSHDAELLKRMTVLAKPVVKEVGLNLLKIGKQDTKGELYDPNYYNEKMIILGKSEPAAFRPDDPTKQITDQFCVLSERGRLYELMYSNDGFLTDSFLNPIEPKTAIERYGYDVLFMLYQGMHDYLKSEQELVAALEKVIGLVFASKPRA
ncbi:hypothetical protein [Methanoregula sp.]|uniref:hypothetical protein n=1 Tax=Methanoregula sp. TaxID=2052170 RepID=UPI002BC89962|nr:hypothetical protein [Methanoregula sp.]HVP97556.1 hypothetical protein [Methanoregula sp.]